jgi:multidrug efflux pump
VLCIGLVVDDAIVVLENIQRRADLGEPVPVAALRGTAQVAFAVIATTAVLVAVFLPIGLHRRQHRPPVPRTGGGIGRRGRDLGLRRAHPDADDVVAAAAPAWRRSAVSPHVSSNAAECAVAGIARLFVAQHRSAVALFGVMLAALAACYGICRSWCRANWRRRKIAARSSSSVVGPEGAGFDYTVDAGAGGRRDAAEAGRRRQADATREHSRARRFRRQRGNAHRQGIVFLQPLGQARTINHRGGRQDAHRPGRAAGVRGLRKCARAWCAASGQPFQVVLGGPDYAELAQWRDRLMARMEKNPGLFAVDSDYKETRPQMRVSDRSRACRRSRRVGGRHRPHAGNDDGFAPRHHLRRGWRGIRRDPAGGTRDRAAPADLRNLYVRAAAAS